ncbi:hypothetical protein [Primorskyibacter sp. S187A]|uniref:hypothetical protein n=1 Tax=Primorskyibacter sp. S187A TaxID=3415130 RepID=UPI003C7C571D
MANRLEIKKAQKYLGVSHCFKTIVQETSKKIAVLEKKGLRVTGLIRKYPLTGGAEAHNGTPDGTTERRSRGKRGKKL